MVPTSWVDDTGILVIPGVEVTALDGHFNILNTNTTPFKDQTLDDLLSEEGMLDIVQGDYGHALVSINHPFLTEWKWKFGETPLAAIDTMEICNDPTYSYNDQATEWTLQAWDYLLQAGYTITGIGGSDSHMLPTETYEGSEITSLIGDPGTFVFCDQLSAAQVVDNVRAGHVIVSRGEYIDFHVDSQIAGTHSERRAGTAHVAVVAEESLYFEWILDGTIVRQDVGPTASFDYDFTDEKYHYLRVNVRYLNGDFYGFTNPVYFGSKQPSVRQWKEVLAFMDENVHD